MIDLETLRKFYEEMLSRREGTYLDGEEEIYALGVDPSAFIQVITADVNAMMSNLETEKELPHPGGNGNPPVALLLGEELASYFAAQFHDGFVLGFMVGRGEG